LRTEVGWWFDRWICVKPWRFVGLNPRWRNAVAQDLPDASPGTDERKQAKQCHNDAAYGDAFFTDARLCFGNKVGDPLGDGAKLTITEFKERDIGLPDLRMCSSILTGCTLAGGTRIMERGVFAKRRFALSYSELALFFRKQQLRTLSLDTACGTLVQLALRESGIACGDRSGVAVLFVAAELRKCLLILMVGGSLPILQIHAIDVARISVGESGLTRDPVHFLASVEVAFVCRTLFCSFAHT